MNARLRGLRSEVGGIVLSSDELSRTLEVPVESVERWTSHGKVRATSLSSVDLAAKAAAACLRDVAVAASDLDFIIWCSAAPRVPSLEGRRELHLQQLLGADRAVAVEMGSSCTELISGIQYGAQLLHCRPEYQRVLVASGETYLGSSRLLGANFNLSYAWWPIFSDGAVAVLLEREQGHAILGFGEATEGGYWDYIPRVSSGKLDMSAAGAGMDATRDAVALARLALKRCLEMSRLAATDIQHIIWSSEGTRVPATLIRNAGLPVDRVFFPEQGVTHTGTSDVLITLALLEQSGRARPDEVVLVASRTPGIMRFVALRLGPARERSTTSS